MPFRYACFVSYRHGQREAVRDTVRGFRDSLAGELEFWFGSDLPVYLDEGRLQPGNLYNEALATALCQSVCMVMLFTPTYFDSVHRYCAREYRGMLALERQRFAVLDKEQQQHGLIIPIILRGARYLPPEIKNSRHSRNFESFFLGEPDTRKHPDYHVAIKELAEYIYESYTMMRPMGEELCRECDAFSLPLGEDLDDWLQAISVPAVPFPGPRRQGSI